MSIILFILILFTLVLVHELGHYLVAKLFGIRVDEFGFGYPPRAAKLFRWKETDFTLNWLPFGGFVKIFGEDPTEENTSGPDTERSFINKPWYAQALVLIAGVTMNFLLGWLLLSGSFMTGIPTSVGSEPAGSKVENIALMVTSVSPGTPAEKAGILPGDIIDTISATSDDMVLGMIHTPSIEQVQEFIKAHGNNTISLQVLRKEKTETLNLTPKISDGKPAIGISMDMVGTLKLGFFGSLWTGLKAAGNMTIIIIKTFATLIHDAVLGHANLSQVTGPVGIVGVVGDAARIGFVYLISLTALISLNLTVINLIPFPALDGGRLLFVLIEAVTRRKIPAKVANILNILGFGILILFMLVVTYHDILKLVR
jgi:regulator of sigma E protease